MNEYTKNDKIVKNLNESNMPNQTTQFVTQNENNLVKKSKNELLKEIKVDEEVRLILNVPNKNNLYNDLGLNPTYLNLKNFISGKELELKKKSIEYISNKLNLLPIQLFIDLDNLEEEELEVLKRLQIKYLEKLVGYTKKFENDQRRIKKNRVTDEDVQKVQKIISEVAMDLDLNDLDIHI